MSHDGQYVMLVGQDPDRRWFACEDPARTPDTFTAFHLEYDGRICRGCYDAALAMERRGDKYGRELALQTGRRRPRR